MPWLIEQITILSAILKYYCELRHDEHDSVNLVDANRDKEHQALLSSWWYASRISADQTTESTFKLCRNTIYCITWKISERFSICIRSRLACFYWTIFLDQWSLMHQQTQHLKTINVFLTLLERLIFHLWETFLTAQDIMNRIKKNWS